IAPYKQLDAPNLYSKDVQLAVHAAYNASHKVHQELLTTQIHVFHMQNHFSPLQIDFIWYT
ncbi:MAG: hypothetical protein EZS28_046288, partial [Streblomastix strix]